MATFKSRYVIDVYAMARDGANDKTIAKKLGVTPAGFVGWKRRHKGIRYALKRGQKDRKGNTNINWTEYIRGQLPKHLQQLWDKITEFGQDPSGYGKIEKLLSKESRRARQELLVYAILTSSFSLSKALRMVAIPRSTFLHWAENDPEFVELLTEVDEIKKDFFEEGLLKLVKAGDSPATIFGNRTLNRNRGYGEVTETRVSGVIGVASLPISELNLSPDILRSILKAVELKELEQKQLPVGVNNVIDNINTPRKKRVKAKVS